MELRDLYNRLIKEDYWPVQIHQLLFLYRFLRERGEEDCFYAFLDQIDSGYETEKLEQFVKCITHDIPYGLFIENDYVRAEEMNEMRRYLEDALELCKETEKWERYYLLTKKIISKCWSSQMIYQIRRFLKCEKPLEIEYLEKVFEFIDENKIRCWVVMNRLYETYITKGADALLSQIDNKAFVELVRSYHENDESAEGDYLLIQIMEFSE